MSDEVHEKRETVYRLARGFGVPPLPSELSAALDALILAARRDERERLASAVELPATDPCSPTALCGWAKEPPGLAAWLRKEASAFFHGDRILPAPRVPPSGGFGRLVR